MGLGFRVQGLGYGVPQSLQVPPSPKDMPILFLKVPRLNHTLIHTRPLLSTLRPPTKGIGFRGLGLRAPRALLGTPSPDRTQGSGSQPGAKDSKSTGAHHSACSTTGPRCRGPSFCDIACSAWGRGATLNPKLLNASCNAGLS